MTGIQSSLYTVAIALCVFSAGILREKRSRSGRPVAWFTTFILVATLGFAFELAMMHPTMPLKGLWLGMRMGMALLVAPCLWLAVKESVEGCRPGIARLSRGQRCAIVAGFVLLLPLMERAHLGLGYANPEEPISPWHLGVIRAGMLGCVAIFTAQVPYYVWQSRRLLLAADAASRWLQWPLLVVLTTWLVGLSRALQCMSHAGRRLDLAYALIDVGVTVGAMYLIVRRRPADESITPPVEEPEDASPPLPIADPAAAAVEEKYARSRLDAPTRARIRRKVETALAAPETYCDSLLNLRSLSRQIGEKAHYVSQVINQDLNSSFYDLVNRHRVAQAKRLLVEAPEQTVLEIALAVGFNAKSTFNTAFRRYTGMTPSAYRADPSG